MFDSLSRSIDDWLTGSLSFESNTALFMRTLMLTLALIVLTYLVWRVSKWLLHRFVPRITSQTKTLWDDAILNDRVLNSVAWLIPVILLDYFAPHVLQHTGVLLPFVKDGTTVIIVFTIALIIASLFNGINDMLAQNPDFHDKPIGSITQLGKILVYGVATILAISIIFNKSPIYLLSGIGAIAAVLLLVFKDSILGFVASVQLSANNMVHVGDWVTVPKFNADGDVLEINLTTIKVQNFDKTITTIPTYAFVSDSFTNWRGMERSPGRRIKRSVFVQISSIKFCTPELLSEFKKIHLVKDHILTRQAEIDAFNAEHGFDGSVMVNGRKMTNIGVFQVYLNNYLHANPAINTDMTTMVRQLPPTPNGVPIEVYAFSKEKEWQVYEGIIADLFDHILSAAQYFELNIFENPTGDDFKSYNNRSH